jgi:hypothetical protein
MATRARWRAPPASDAAVTLSQERVGARRSAGHLAHDALQIGVAPGGRAALALWSRLDRAWCELRPGHQVGGGWELGHVEAGLGDDDLGGAGPSTGHLVETSMPEGGPGAISPVSGSADRSCPGSCSMSSSTRAVTRSIFSLSKPADHGSSEFIRRNAWTLKRSPSVGGRRPTLPARRVLRLRPSRTPGLRAGSAQALSS